MSQQAKAKTNLLWPIAILLFVLAIFVLAGCSLPGIFKGRFFAPPPNGISGTGTAYAAAPDDTGYFSSGYIFDQDAATAEEINKILEGTPMAGLGEAIKKTAEKYHLNPVYIAAHAGLESSWGASRIAQDKKNLFGYGARDVCPYECAHQYDSFEQCIDVVMGEVKKDYLTPGGQYYYGETLEAMNKKYATASHWASSIKNIMIEIYRKIGKQPPLLAA